MKSPLSYQVTEYDCGPTTMLNAISVLFRREEIPPDIVKHIMLYSLDAYNRKGEYAKSGTSAMAMLFLSSWLNQFGKVKQFPVEAQFLEPEEVAVKRNGKIVSALQQGGVVVARVLYGCWHYVLLTGVEPEEEQILLFDPYYRRKPFSLPGVELVEGAPLRYNRSVSFSRLNAVGKTPYALGVTETREAMILFNRETRKTAENTIEYFI